MKPKQWLVISLLTTLFYSCSAPRYIYSASPPNNTYFKQKGDSKLAGYYSSGSTSSAASRTDSRNRGFDIQAAYAITDHWALTAAMFSRKEKDVFREQLYNYFSASTIDYKRHLMEAGGGYFTTLNPAKTIGFTFFGNLGFGKFKLRDAGLTDQQDSYSRFYDSRIRKFSFQPGFSLMPGKNFRMMLVQRFSFVHYGNISTSYSAEEKEYFLFAEIENKTRSFAETTVGLQLIIPGVKWLAIDASVTMCSQPTIEYERLRARGFNASVGLSMDLFKMRD